MTRYHFTRESSNAKTGPIPVTTTSADTCPDSCPFKRNGCYADGGPLRMHWDKVTRGERGTDLPGLCEQIESLPAGQLWRHDQAGDLPGRNNRIAPAQLREIARANVGRRGFTYTHKPATPANLRAIREASALGFTINLSANSLAHADTLAETAPGLPLVAVVPEHPGKTTSTPAGRPVTVCPATYRDDVTCASCGLCQRSNRRAIVAFPAHGSSRRKAAEASTAAS